MDYEWDEIKAVSNIEKHGVSFDEAATVFLDPLALSGPDPDHSNKEDRYITFGHSSLGRLLSVCHTYRPGTIRESLPPASQHEVKGSSMKKANDDIRPEYKRSDFKKLERGKFFTEAKAGMSVALLEPEIAKAFPTSKAVNEALHGLLSIAEQASRITSIASGCRGKRGTAVR